MHRKLNGIAIVDFNTVEQSQLCLKVNEAEVIEDVVSGGQENSI